MLDDFEGIVEMLVEHRRKLFRGPTNVTEGDIYCPQCGGPRRVSITKLWAESFSDQLVLGAPGPFKKAFLEGFLPTLFVMMCVQCDHVFTALVHAGPDGKTLAVLPESRGGLTTTHTPAAVAYYLDQAYKAKSVGASSGAVAMFRGALEHLLFDQGFQTGMLGAKIGTLEEDIGAGTAPKWAMDLDIEFLKVLKELGNASIHTNDGDVSLQAALDNELLTRVQATFLMLLQSVYEEPRLRAERLAALKASAAAMKPDPGTSP